MDERSHTRTHIRAGEPSKSGAAGAQRRRVGQAIGQGSRSGRLRPCARPCTPGSDQRARTRHTARPGQASGARRRECSMIGLDVAQRGSCVDPRGRARRARRSRRGRARRGAADLSRRSSTAGGSTPPDSTCLQFWIFSPLKRIIFIPAISGSGREFKFSASLSHASHAYFNWACHPVGESFVFDAATMSPKIFAISPIANQKISLALCRRVPIPL
jgi:hypothetical protein